MNKPSIQTMMSEARACAIAMGETAACLERELPNIRMPEPLLPGAWDLCIQLSATKSEVLQQLSALNRLLAERVERSRIVPENDRIARSLWRSLSRVHQLVTELDAAAHADSLYGNAYAVLAECALNILRPFSGVRSAASIFIAGG
jgi:hypothetical protein